MSKKLLPRGEALEDISSWNTNNVIRLLRKNGLDDCCEAVAKRQIDGDGLLHLTEGKLALWKSDLTRPLIWSLWTFVEDVKKFPEKYTEVKKSDCTQDNVPQENSEDALSDGSSWGTDFDEEDIEDSFHTKNAKDDVDKCHGNGKENKTENKIESDSVIGTLNPQDESTYANCEPLDEDNNIYANLENNSSKKLPTKNVSQLHSPSNDVNFNEQFKDQLQPGNLKKPTIGPKPETFITTVKKIVPPKQPQKSFLHDTSKSKKITVVPHNEKKTSTAAFIELKSEIDKSVTAVHKFLKDFSLKPPATIRNFDLVANLPTRVDESEDEYEPVDKQISDQYQKSQIIPRVDSKQSLTSGHQSSVESIYQSPSTTSHEGEVEEPYEIYESITESPEDDGYYLSPISRRLVEPGIPPPLPAKLPQSTTKSSLTLPSRPSTEKPRERSPDKKSATLPHSGSNVSLSSERATRPLPPPPERQSYTDKPWFHNVTREQAIVMIKDQGTYGNQRDGHFLLRPSTTNINNPLALVLWYKDRVYNVPVRKRHDNRYALGSEKVNEKTFASVEEIVNFYSREELVLHTGGVQAGSTKLTDTPPK